MNKKLKNVLIICIGIIISLLVVYACYKLIPLLVSLKDADIQELFKSKINSLGWKGWFAMLALQVLQIFIAFIPGEVVEILAGMLYGTFGGLLICLGGIILASILIYYTVKLFANKNLNKYKEKLSTYSFLNSPKKVHMYFFILFLIPGIPKDIFIYLVPFLPIKLSTFLIVSSFARIPSIISSTIVGDNLASGNYIISIIVFLVFAVLGVLAILLHDKIINLFKKHHNKELNTSDTMEN